MIFCGTSFYNDGHASTNDDSLMPGCFAVQQDPFYFLHPVPDKIKLLNNIDLSFLRNKLIVIQYRYRLEIPRGAKTEIERNLLKWSLWINFDLTQVIVPKIDQEGGYKLVIEYKTQADGETMKFEKPFYVYDAFSLAAASNDYSLMQPRSDNSAATLKGVTQVPSARTNGRTVSDAVSSAHSDTIRESSDSTTQMGTKPVFPSADTTGANKRVVSGQLELKDLKEKAGVDRKIIPQVEMKSDEISDKPVPIEKVDTQGFDRDGNTPLHLAILTGKGDYASSLIKQGTDLNIKNKMDFSPLHLAVLLNQDKVVNDLIKNGAYINNTGNSGYTPLHIAAELNYIGIALKLLENGASTRVKTNQRLSPKTIAKIQNNDDMASLIRKKGDYTVNIPAAIPAKNITFPQGNKNYPEINFNLPYDKKLINKRQFNKVIQIISIPVFVLSAASAVYLKSEGDYYHLKYHNTYVESQERAMHYYDQAKQYYTNMYISGGVSLTSVYSFIHTTIRKNSISNKMRKTEYE